MVQPTANGISRYQYGDTSLWIHSRNLGGSRAVKLMEKLELHFREQGSPLVLDLRETTFIDSDGAELLETACRRHAGLAIVGRPRDFNNLPQSVMETIDVIQPAQSIEEALSSLKRQLGPQRRGGARRRHHRFAARIAVEIRTEDLSTAATLSSISLGGGKIGLLPSRWISEVENIENAPEISIAGLDHDPLGKEIAGRHHNSVLASRPVYLLDDHSGLGVKFSGTPGPARP